MNRIRIKLIVTFLMHQLIATLGVAVTAGLLTGFAFDLLRWFGLPFPIDYMHWVLTGTPYYPIQIATGLISGVLLGRWLRHRAMLWVWVLPAVWLCYLLIALPTFTSQMAADNRFWHFFGWGCRPENRCFDQIGGTAPFYLAAAYSIGALLARRIGKKPAGE